MELKDMKQKIEKHMTIYSYIQYIYWYKNIIEDLDCKAQNKSLLFLNTAQWVFNINSTKMGPLLLTKNNNIGHDLGFLKTLVNFDI